MDRDSIEVKNEIVNKIKNLAININYLETPAIPELTFKPDFMINIENNLVFVNIELLKPYENIDWKTLRLIEYVFELKLFFGNKSRFNLIIPNRDDWIERDYCLELLERFYDNVIYGFDIKDIRDIFPNPNQDNFRLWELEREYKSSRLERFNLINLNNFRYHDIQKEEFQTRLTGILSNLQIEYNDNWGIRNLKNYYLSRDLNLKFYYDYFINDYGYYRNNAGIIIEIKSIKRFTYKILQNLLIKARLIRYKKQDNEIRRHERMYKMILLINGSLIGPDYDELRFLRMLTSVGWDVYPIDVLDNDEEMMRIITNDP